MPKSKQLKKRLSEIAVLKTHIINYIKTRDIYAAYRQAGYSKRFLAEHEGELLLHKAAKKAFDELGVKKLPTVKKLQAEYAEILTEKKGLYRISEAAFRNAAASDCQSQCGSSAGIRRKN